MKNFFSHLIIPLLFLALTLLYLFPLLQGLILLPLDLLISNYAPWYSPGTILLKNPYMQDSIVQLFPWRHLVFESLTSGILPLWNPYQQLGAPFMANMKPLVFYPFNLFFIFGEISAWHFLLLGQVFLSMLFCYLLIRDFKLPKLPSIFVALSFALNSFMIGLLEFGSDAHTMVWWPVILLFTKRYIETQKRKYLFFLSLSIALSILGGQLQYMGYFFIFLFAFIIYYGLIYKIKQGTYIFLVISIILGLGLTALQMLPTVELFSYSHRGLLSPTQQHAIFSSGLSNPTKLFRLFAPDFFGNPVSHDTTSGYIETSGYFSIIALFFTFFAIAFGQKNIFVRFFTGSFLVAMVLSLQGIGELPYLLKIPLITSGSGGRIFTLVLFSGALLAGFGLAEFIRMKERKKQLWSLLAFVLLFLLTVLGSYLSHIFGSFETLIRSVKFAVFILFLFCIGIIGYCFAKKWKQYAKPIEIVFLLFLIFLIFFDLFRFGYRFLTFSNEKFLYPQLGVTTFLQDATASTLGRVYGLTEPELGTYLHIYSIETYNPLYLLRTSEFLQSLQKLPINDLSIDNKYFLSSSGNELKYTLDVLGTEYIVTAKDENPATKYFQNYVFQPQLQKVYTDEHYAVYKNMTSYPRFGLYYHYITSHNDELTRELFTKRKVDLQQTLILTEVLPITLTEGTGSAKLIKTNLNEQLFAVTSDRPTLFYVSDTWYPGWQATINNNYTKIYRANYNLRAVLVPEGKSLIRFYYLPQSFIAGIGISCASFLLVLSLAFLPKQKSRKVS